MPRARARLRDWLFGAPGKRRLLEALLADQSRIWTQTELARAAGMHRKGSVDEPLLALVQMGMVAERAGRYQLDSNHALVAPLTGLLTALRQVPDDAVKRPGG